MPIAHGEGNYTANSEVLKQLNGENRVLFRYVSEAGDSSSECNPNGSLENIAGIMNEKGNVLGMMPHPERISEEILGGEDGCFIWKSIIEKVNA